MDLMEAIRARHSVRKYLDRAIAPEIAEQLRAEIDICNRESGLHMQLITEEKSAFAKGITGYGKFENVSNYIAIVGKTGSDFDEKCGYFGEKIVLLAQQLGLNTCWVAMTFNKGNAKKHIQIDAGEKLAIVISLGYGATQGTARKTKSFEELGNVGEEKNIPDWFRRGIEAAQLAPTAMNQQAFQFKLDGNAITAIRARGFYTKMDLGIAKYHFEIGAGESDWHWAG